MKSAIPADDIAAADRFVAGLRGVGESVLSVVPAGFEAYVRVFHPAHIDFKSTYLGCSAACAEDVLALRGLEALAIEPSAGIDRYSDVFKRPSVM